LEPNNLKTTEKYSNPQKQSGDAYLIYAQDRLNQTGSTFDFSLWGSACSEYCVITTALSGQL